MVSKVTCYPRLDLQYQKFATWSELSEHVNSSPEWSLMSITVSLRVEDEGLKTMEILTAFAPKNFRWEIKRVLQDQRSVRDIVDDLNESGI